MNKVIESVEVVHQLPVGPDLFRIGSSVFPSSEEIADIIEINGTFFFYNGKDELLMEIRNCPVVVKYKVESEV